MEKLVQHGDLESIRWFLDLGEKELRTKHTLDTKLSSDENTSNFVESFNATLGIHQSNPILSLLEGVRTVVMVRHATRQNIVDSWPDDGFFPNILNRLRVLTKDSRHVRTYNSGRGKFEEREGHSHLKVNSNDKTCACGAWQLCRIPCRHAIRAILDADNDPSDFVSDWYSVTMYKEAYNLCISPVPDSHQWHESDQPLLESQPMRRAIGRPARNRRREPGEQRKGKMLVSIKCKKCRCYGHNSKTCKGGYTSRERDQMQGKQVKNKFKRANTGLSVELTQEIEGSQSQTVERTRQAKKRKTK